MFRVFEISDHLDGVAEKERRRACRRKPTVLDVFTWQLLISGWAACISLSIRITLDDVVEEKLFRTLAERGSYDVFILARPHSFNLSHPPLPTPGT